MAFMLSLADVENARSVAERYCSSYFSDFSFLFQNKLNAVLCFFEILVS